MQMARVVGTVVATQKDPKLVGLKLQLVQPIDIGTGTKVASLWWLRDTVGAGSGDMVMIVGGSSARQTDQTASSPVDMAIVGIIDVVEIEGRTIYDRKRKSLRLGSLARAWDGGEAIVRFGRVVGNVVCTAKDANLEGVKLMVVQP